MFLFALVAVLLIVAYLLTPSQTTDAPAPAGMADFNFPDNSIGKPVPRLYGYAMLKGNCIYVDGLRNEKIEICP